MSLFGFGGQKGQKPKKAKKSNNSKPREVWQGKSFALDNIITPSTFVGGGENSPDPFLIDLPTVTSSEFDFSHTDLLKTLETGNLDLLLQPPDNSLLDHHTISNLLIDPSFQPLPLFDNLPVSTNSFTEHIQTFDASDACSADVPTNIVDPNSGVYDGTFGLPPFNPPDVDSPGHVLPFDPPGTDKPPKFNFKKSDQPLIGVIDTGFNAKNPDIDYSRVKLGKDFVDNDNDPLISNGEGNEHGTFDLGIIAATENNDIGIDGINDQAPIWVGRAIGSGKWAESLREFVDELKASGQPNGLVNLSLDLTQQNPDGTITTRYEFTPQEREALEYARQNHVLIVAAAGNDGGVMSVLGQASQEFDNIITVGAADGENRAAYSSYGDGLDILANGGTIDDPVLSTVGDGVGTMAGTSVATAQVTGAASQVWAANPNLNYRQVIDILKSTATDVNTPGWDAQTGAGLLDIEAAVEQAKNTTPEVYNPEAFLTPTTWGGEGQVTPSERAVSVEFNGKYYDWEPYTIQRGDTLSGIALRTMGNSSAPYYNFIAQKNGIGNPNFIYTGQTISVPKQVSPPTVNLNNTLGYDGGSTHQTYINTFNRNGGSSVLGSPINNVHPWEGGYIQDFSGGSDYKGGIMKSNANDNSYWVGGDFWNKFLDTGGAGNILKYPTSDRYGTNGGLRQDFQGGAILKSGRGIFPVFGGIGGHYLNNEGGQNGRLGFPTSGEIGVGNGVIVQNFENGRIVYGDGPTRTEMNNQPAPTSTTINSYTVSGNFYPVFQNYRGTLGNPISGVTNYANGVTYQLFERGSIVSSQYGTFPIFGGIRQTYLNTGGLNGWLGAPKSTEIGQGNGVIIQNFANGYILWNGSKATAYRNGSGTPSQGVPTPQPDNNIKLKNFRGWVMPGIGVALRNSPHFNDKSGKAEPYGKWLEFDAWTYGDTVNDYKVGTPDSRWFRVKGTNYWVPSAYIYGNPEGLPGIETPGSGSSGSNNNNQPITSYADYLKRLYGGSPGVISQYPKPDHNAIDSVNQGSYPYKVYALTGGVVKYKGTDKYGGNYVQIWNPELQRYFYYVHFANFNPALKVGQQIKAGDYLGNEGSTGNSTGRHTHVHVTLPDGRTRVDPLSALSKSSGSSGGGGGNSEGGNNAGKTITPGEHKEYEKLVFSVYEDQDIEGYKVVKKFDDSKTGFYALMLTSETKPPVLVIRGTQPSDILDIFDDANPKGIGYGQFENNESDISYWLDKVKKETGYVPDVIGHSLGGALAQLVSARFTDKVGKTVTFNSPGVSDSAVREFQSHGGKSKEDVTHYIISGDLVSMAGQSYLPGKVTFISYSDTNIVDTINPISEHLIGFDKKLLDPNTQLRDFQKDSDFSVDWLSSDFFLYIDPDYFTFLLTVAEIVPVVGTQIALSLITRASTEANRYLIGSGLHTLSAKLQEAANWAGSVWNVAKELGEATLKTALEFMIKYGAKALHAISKVIQYGKKSLEKALDLLAKLGEKVLDIMNEVEKFGKKMLDTVFALLDKAGQFSGAVLNAIIDAAKISLQALQAALNFWGSIIR